VNQPSVGIVGAGILGLTVAHRLTQAGVRVTLYERSNDVGGLVGAFDFDGHRVDRFYHVVLPTDQRVRGLAEELGLGDRFRFRPSGVGFYDDDRLFSMNSLLEFLRFPLLPMHDRLRLGAFVARCQTISDHSALDETPLLEWLRRLCGRRIVERMWRPLLDSKFDGNYDDLPASYLWARTRRMSSTRDKSGREIMGWLEGGYETLTTALAEAIVAGGGEIHTGVAVDQVVGSATGAAGIVVGGSFKPFDSTLVTLLPPLARRLLAPELATAVPEDHCRYLGVICVIVRTAQSVSPYYTLNITDRRVPLTTIVETTHVVDPEHVGGHLLYAAKYVDPSHPDLKRPEADVADDYLRHVRTIFPALTDADIKGVVVQRAPAVEPVHVLGGASRLPSKFPVPGLALVSTAHVYPEVVNGQAVIGVADEVVEGLLQRLPAAHEAAA
jgi:protoporphyrinogen oxidase